MFRPRLSPSPAPIGLSHDHTCQRRQIRPAPRIVHKQPGRYVLKTKNETIVLLRVAKEVKYMPSMKQKIFALREMESISANPFYGTEDYHEDEMNLSIEAEAMEDVVIDMNALEMLSAQPKKGTGGQAAGVQVTAANGRPGNTAFVNIRGVGSINAQTTPLYVIDGVPIPIDTERDFNPISNINPSDIESFSILKDAATVSKYGSRGANGVVLITTNKGRSGEAQIKFNSSYGFGERIPDPFDLMDSSQKLELERQFADLGVGAASSLPGATASPEELRRLIALDTDWEEALLRKSIIQSNNLSISFLRSR